MAVEALHYAKNVGAWALELTGFSARNESRIYACSECAGFHLTSKAHRVDARQVA